MTLIAEFSYNTLKNIFSRGFVGHSSVGTTTAITFRRHSASLSRSNAVSKRSAYSASLSRSNAVSKRSAYNNYEEYNRCRLLIPLEKHSRLYTRVHVPVETEWEE